jgi:hypothetical protein
MFDFDSRNAAARISQLEAAINEKAGSKLLAWESDFGLPSANSTEKRMQHVIAPLRFVWQQCAAHLKRLRGSN